MADTETEVKHGKMPTAAWAILWMAVFALVLMGFMGAANLADQVEVAHWPFRDPGLVLVLSAALATGAVATYAKTHYELVNEDD